MVKLDKSLIRSCSILRKRILSLLIACSMLAAVGTGISAYAAEVDSGLSSGNNVLSQSSASEIDKKIYDDFEYVTYESQNHSKVHITSYLGNNSSVVFPNTIEGKPVVSIEIYYYLNGEENTTVKSVTVPANCESCRFDNFAALEEIKVNSGNSKYKSVNGVLIAKDKTEFCYPRNNKATSFAIPENVTWVKSNAFFKCKNLTSVTVNDKASLIGGSGGGCGLSTCPFILLFENKRVIIILKDNIRKEVNYNEPIYHGRKSCYYSKYDAYGRYLYDCIFQKSPRMRSGNFRCSRDKRKSSERRYTICVTEHTRSFGNYGHQGYQR